MPTLQWASEYGMSSKVSELYLYKMCEVGTEKIIKILN